MLASSWHAQPPRPPVLLRLNRADPQKYQTEQRAAALVVLHAVRQRGLLRLNRANRQNQEMEKGPRLGDWSRRGSPGVA